MIRFFMFITSRGDHSTRGVSIFWIIICMTVILKGGRGFVTDPCGSPSLPVWSKMIEGICFWITQSYQDQPSGQSLCQSQGGHLVMEITHWNIVSELYSLASKHNVHQKYKYIGYYVDPTIDPYSNFTTITGLLPGYDRFPQSAPTRSKDHYCVSLLNELYFAWVCDENLNAVCSNFTYVPITTEPIPNTTRHNPTSTEPIPETSERVHTTTEPILTTTEPIQTTSESSQTTSESSQTTTEPIQTTTEPIQTTAEFIQSTTEYMQTTREPSPTTTITSHKTTSETSNGCDCVEFCRPSNYNSTNALLINDTEKLQERLKAISDILKVEKSTLSSVVRKKTSAPDERTSSTNIGYFGIAIIVSAISILVMFDIIKCFQTCFG